MARLSYETKLIKSLPTVYITGAGQAGTLLGSRKKLEAGKMLENAAESTHQMHVLLGGSTLVTMTLYLLVLL